MTKFMQPVSQEILVGIPLSGRECQLVQKYVKVERHASDFDLFHLTSALVLFLWEMWSVCMPSF